MINCLNSLGVCESKSSIFNFRNLFASVDEFVVKKYANLGVCHIIFDNLDFYVKKLHNLTLPVLMFELHPTFHLDTSDEKTLHDTLDLFSRDLLDLNSDTNQQEREHFLFVIKTVLAHDICKEVEGLSWISSHFDKHHQHPHSETAATRSIIHVDPPLALDEKKLVDMTQILQTFVDRYLNILAENLTDDEKEKFLDCKKKVELVSCSEVELKQSEAYLMEIANKYGCLIIHGDLLRWFININFKCSTQKPNPIL